MKLPIMLTTLWCVVITFVACYCNQTRHFLKSKQHVVLDSVDAWTDGKAEVSCCAHLCPCPNQMTEKATLCPGRIVHKGLKFDGKQRESQFQGSRASAEALFIIRAVRIRR